MPGRLPMNCVFPFVGVKWWFGVCLLPWSHRGTAGCRDGCFVVAAWYPGYSSQKDFSWIRYVA